MGLGIGRRLWEWRNRLVPHPHPAATRPRTAKPVTPASPLSNSGRAPQPVVTPNLGLADPQDAYAQGYAAGFHDGVGAGAEGEYSRIQRYLLRELNRQTLDPITVNTVLLYLGSGGSRKPTRTQPFDLEPPGPAQPPEENDSATWPDAASANYAIDGSQYVPTETYGTGGRVRIEPPHLPPLINGEGYDRDLEQEE